MGTPTVTLLNMFDYGVVHYLEQRDNGLNHVFRSLSEDALQLDKIEALAPFVRDKYLLSKQLTTSCLSSDITKDVVIAIKQEFPKATSVKIEKDKVTYDKVTQKVDAYFHHYLHSDHPLIDKNTSQSTYDLMFEIERISDMENLNQDDIYTAKQEFLSGVLNDSTLPIWKVFFKGARHSIKSEDDLKVDPFKSYLRWMEMDIRQKFHPGCYSATLVENANKRHEMTQLSGRLNDASGQSIPILNHIELHRNLEDNYSDLADFNALNLRDKVLLSESLSKSSLLRIGYVGSKNKHDSDTIKNAINNALDRFNDGNLETIDDYLKASQTIVENNADFAKALYGRIGYRHKAMSNMHIMRNALESPNIIDLYVQKEKQEFSQALNSFEDRIGRCVNATLIEISNEYTPENVHALRQTLSQLSAVNQLIKGHELDALDSIIKGDSFKMDRQIYPTTSVGGHVYFESLTHVLKVFTEMEALEVQQKIEAAREEGRQALQDIKLIDSDDDQSIKEHIDVGEKIGGAKKDKYASINSINILELSLEEKVNFTDKNKVWPLPNWSAMIDDGMEPTAALCIKYFRDAISMRPEELTNSWTNRKYIKPATSDRDVVAWVKAVEIVRDHLISTKTFSDMKIAIKRMAEALAEKSEFNYRYSDALGNTFRKKYSSEYYMSRVPDAIESSMRYGLSDDVIKGRYLKIKPPKQDDKLTDEDSANEDANEDTKKILPYPEHLKEIKREGVDWRKDANVTGEMLLQIFGFKGVEYGNWVANKERQIVLNHAFDAFMDLAHSIGLSDKELKMISFNGELSISFGSRGSGRALAHYEPLKKVINLTKIKGAGSLAHEWMHALDHYIGEAAGVTTLRKKLYSEIVMDEIDSTSNHLTMDERMAALSNSHHRFLMRIDAPGHVKKLAMALMDVCLHAKYTEKRQSHIDKELIETYDKLATYVGGWTKYAAHTGLKTMYETAKYPEMDVELITNAIKDAVLKFNQDNDHYNERTASRRLFHDIAIQLVIQSNPQAKDRMGELSENISNCLDMDCRSQPASGLMYCDQEIKKVTNTHYAVKTDFYENAALLDGKARKYWTSPCELLARSFAVAVYDKLTDNSMTSEYLVRGAKENEFSGKEYKGNPNPEGMEREIINNKHDELMAAFLMHSKELINTENESIELSM